MYWTLWISGIDDFHKKLKGGVESGAVEIILTLPDSPSGYWIGLKTSQEWYKQFKLIHPQATVKV